MREGANQLLASNDAYKSENDIDNKEKSKMKIIHLSDLHVGYRNMGEDSIAS